MPKQFLSVVWENIPDQKKHADDAELYKPMGQVWLDKIVGVEENCVVCFMRGLKFFADPFPDEEPQRFSEAAQEAAHEIMASCEIRTNWVKDHWESQFEKKFYVPIVVREGNPDALVTAKKIVESMERGAHEYEEEWYLISDMMDHIVVEEDVWEKP